VTESRALLTVGHGTLPAGAFVDLLRKAGVELVVDVRRYPGSRRNPQFGRDALAATLAEAGIAYRWEEALGGRRATTATSPNRALRNAAFRGYADHMATGEFNAALSRLVEDAAARTTAVLCAESLWWRCHRRLLADAASIVRGLPVAHLGHDGRLAPHAPTEGVRPVAGGVVYDGAATPTLPGLD